VFNPFLTRNPSMPSKLGQFLLEGRRLNRRMHNKSFISDSTVAIVGGRNIGDDYFDAARDTNFRDLDVIAIGPVVKETSQIFDAYWKCDAAFPVTAFQNPRDTQADLAQLRPALAKEAREFAESDYAQATLEELPDGATADRRGYWFWGPALVVADQPEKIETSKDVPALRIGPKLGEMIEGAQSEVFMISPYFVPGDAGTKFLISLVERGVRTEVLTNSLAATDEPVVHSGYARYRRRLLEGGVVLHELRGAPGAEQHATARGASSGVSLHAKALVVDRQYTFIGSLNMDQRSKLLNTEMGVIVDSVPLALAVRSFFDTAIEPGNSFRVAVEPPRETSSGSRRMSWHWSEDGLDKSGATDPGATSRRRMQVFMFGLLPIEGLL